MPSRLRIDAAPVDVVADDAQETPRPPINLARVQAGLNLSTAITEVLAGRHDALSHQLDDTSAPDASKSPAGPVLLHLLRNPES